MEYFFKAIYNNVYLHPLIFCNTKIMKKKIIYRFLLICGLGIMIACQKNPEFVIKGIVAGADGQTIYLENIGLASVELMDSLKLNSSGQFNFKKPRPDYPDFYRLRLNNQLINFAIDSTEIITITADAGTFATSYTVEGSINSVAIKEINLAQLDANHEYRRLRTEFEAANISDSIFEQLTVNVINEYKSVALKYIYNQPMSPAAYFALFQKIDGTLLFDLFDSTDSRAYGAVATSFNQLFPQSPRAMHLSNLALQSRKVIRSERVTDLNVQEIDLLEMELPDISDKMIKLSDFSKGKVVILNFTAYQTEFSPNLNMVLENVYTRQHVKGLDIYQVSLDSDIHIYRNTASKLPWTCVHDKETIYSHFAALYNVKQLPAVFLIDKNGIVVKRIEDIKTIEEDVISLL